MITGKTYCVMFVCLLCVLFSVCTLIVFVDNLFFYLGGQPVSCKASLAALRLYGYFCDFCCVIIGK